MITPAEVPSLATDGLSLGQQLVAAFSPQSDGGKKLTKKELRALGKELGRFAIKLLFAQAS